MASVLASLSMSALEAVFELRRWRAAYPDASPADLVSAADQGQLLATGLDFRSGLALDTTCENVPDLEAPAGMRRLLEQAIRAERPAWLQLFPRGRKAATEALPIALRQVFRTAGLMDEHPDRAAVEWWDRLSGLVRSESDAALTDLGRQGEYLTLAHEVDRLARLGISRAPRGVSLDDNLLGYDVLSFDRIDGAVVNVPIEVKASANGVRFYVTRNEYEVARRARDVWCLHHWSLRTSQLTRLSFTELEAHMPADAGRGRWQEALVDLRPPS